MNIVVSVEERFQGAQRETNRLHALNLDLMELLMAHEYQLCLTEMGVDVNDL